MAKNPTPAQIAALKKSKGVKSTAKVGNVSPAVKKSMAKQAAIKKAMTPDGKDKVQNYIRAAVVGGAIIKGLSAASAAGRTGASTVSKGVSSTSKTMNVPKGSKVITSGKTGTANATSGVDKVTIQKSPARIEAGKKTYQTVQKAKNANTAVGLATIVTGSYSLGKNSNKKKK
jgi:hypothetical protein